MDGWAAPTNQDFHPGGRCSCPVWNQRLKLLLSTVAIATDQQCSVYQINKSVAGFNWWRKTKPCWWRYKHFPRTWGSRPSGVSLCGAVFHWHFLHLRPSFFMPTVAYFFSFSPACLNPHCLWWQVWVAAAASLWSIDTRTNSETFPDLRVCGRL